MVEAEGGAGATQATAVGLVAGASAETEDAAGGEVVYVVGKGCVELDVETNVMGICYHRKWMNDTTVLLGGEKNELSDCSNTRKAFEHENSASNEADPASPSS